MLSVEKIMNEQKNVEVYDSEDNLDKKLRNRMLILFLVVFLVVVLAFFIGYYIGWEDGMLSITCDDKNPFNFTFLVN